MTKSKRWGKGELQLAVLKVLGKRPQTVNQIIDKLGGKVRYNSVTSVLGRVAKPTGEATRENQVGRPSRTWVRAA
jgi:hypothetical protein